MHLPDDLPPAQSTEFTILMALLMSIVAISIDAMLPALGVIAGDLHLANPNHAQYLIGFIFAGMAMGQLICGPLSDALGRKPVLYFGIGLYLVGSVVCYLAGSLEILLIGRFIQGVGVSGPYVSAVSIVRDKYSGSHMARVMSIIMMIFIMVPAIAPTLGQGILFYASWRAIFLLYIGYALLVGAWLFFRLQETLPPEKRVAFSFANLAHGFREIIGNRVTVCYSLCMGFCFGGFIGYLNSSQQIFQQQFQTGKMFTVYFGVLALIFGAASLTNARLVECLGMHYISIRAIVAMIVSSALFLLVHVFADVTLWMFLVYAAVLFFSFGIAFGNFNAMAMEPMGHIAGMASAIIGASCSVIEITLGAIIGQLYNGTLIPVVSGFFVLSLITLLTMLYARNKLAPVQ